MQFNFIKDKKGFTLIELIVVIAIIAILATIAIPSFVGTIEQSKEGVCISNRHNIELMINIETVQNEEFNSEEYIKNLSPNFLCPIGGVYTIDDTGRVICSEHNNDSNIPNPPPVVNAPLLGNRNDYVNNVVNPDGTILEVPASEYIASSSHKIGDYVIGSDGLIYECIFNRVNSLDPTNPISQHEWRVVGDKDGSVVEVDGETYRSYKPGTTVIQDGVYYMYAPVNSGDFNHTSSLTLGPKSQPSEWIDLTGATPNEYVKPQKDTVMYQAFTAYKKGDVVWHGGKLYKAHSDTTNTDNRTPTGGAWGWDLIE